jgi:AcrR family transcriptional regulator
MSTLETEMPEPTTTKENPQVRSADKRQRLVAAASERFYHQGVERTTLADISAAADVPLGNVYYYFKTKEDLVKAVVDSQVEGMREVIGSLEGDRSPAARLKALTEVLAAQADDISRFGCPEGTLCTELHKRVDGTDPASGRLIQTSLTWVEAQFRAMGRKDARELAIEMISRYQGMALVTHALGDPSLIEQEAKRMSGWIDYIASSETSSTVDSL